MCVVIRSQNYIYLCRLKEYDDKGRHPKPIIKNKLENGDKRN